MLLFIFVVSVSWLSCCSGMHLFGSLWNFPDIISSSYIYVFWLMLLFLLLFLFGGMPEVLLVFAK